ncbi:uncharacterized protein G2W53_026425 [Senna tora]|uniref:Uncharacterized protein n=1 Tax=Senna tora TaxID=362788 RepID=A0A834WF30_9FABA|nr:uncharacterized protein G2W53_026425 [Senna tora]
MDLRNLHKLRGKRLVAQVSETRRFALYLRSRVELMLELESSWRGRSLDHVLIYSGREITVGSQKPSRITRQMTCCAFCVVFAKSSGIDARIGVVMAWEVRGSSLNIFRTTNCGRILETFTNSEAKSLLRKSQKPSQIMRQKTCCEERGSYLNIFRMRNHGWISKSITNYEAKDLLRK